MWTEKQQQFEDFAKTLDLQGIIALRKYIERINLATKINTDREFRDECLQQLIEEYPQLKSVFEI